MSECGVDFEHHVRWNGRYTVKEVSLCPRDDIHLVEDCGFPLELHEGYFSPDPTRDGNKVFSENTQPEQIGSIMNTKLTANQRKVVQVAAVSALTIIAIKQTNKVAKLQAALRKSETHKDFYRDLAVRSTSMMNLPQMLGLVDDAVNDMRFRQITKNL